jgi:hypothetical protein
MKSEALAEFWNCFDALPPGIRERAREAFTLWQRDARHPSLHFKRVHRTKPLYSVRIGERWRALGYLRDDRMVWFWIGAHAEYDKIIRRF